MHFSSRTSGSHSGTVDTRVRFLVPTPHIPSHLPVSHCLTYVPLQSTAGVVCSSAARFSSVVSVVTCSSSYNKSRQ